MFVANGGMLTPSHCWRRSVAHGGLGLAKGIGIGYSIFGLGAFLAQSLFFRHFSAKNHPRTVFIMGASLLAFSSLAMPFTANPTTMVWVWIFWSVDLVVLACGFMTALPIVNAMMANLADPRINGLTQGTAASAASLLRGGAPPLGGFLFSASIARSSPWVLFMFYSAVYVTLIAVALTLL